MYVHTGYNFFQYARTFKDILGKRTIPDTVSIRARRISHCNAAWQAAHVSVCQELEYNAGSKSAALPGESAALVTVGKQRQKKNNSDLHKDWKENNCWYMNDEISPTTFPPSGFDQFLPPKKSTLVNL